TGSLRSLIDGTVGIRAASLGVIAAELVLAGTIWLRPAWRIAAPLGIALHVGIVASGLEIGLFAYLMLGLYLLVLPGSLFVWLAELPAVRALRARPGRLVGRTSWSLWAIALAAGIAIGALVRLEHALAAALVVSALPLVLVVRARLGGRRPCAALSVAHVVALALWLVADRASSVAVDYYKF